MALSWRASDIPLVMCLALVGPGDNVIVPAPYFPVHVYAPAMAAANSIALEVADSEKFLSNIA